MRRLFLTVLLPLGAGAVTLDLHRGTHEASERGTWNASIDAYTGVGFGFDAFQQRYPFSRCSNVGFSALFDWRTTRARHFANNPAVEHDPKTVFTSTETENVRMLLKTLKKFDNGRDDRIAYFTGDLLLSSVDTVIGNGTIDKLRHYFGGGIYYQAYDHAIPGFHVAPDGFNTVYMRNTYDFASKAIASASISAKPLGALASWGCLHKNLNRIPARLKLADWFNTPASVAAGAERRCFEANEYWTELARYRFLLSPRGYGIQSPKNDEALLVLTVPISTREGEDAFDGLKHLGWPMVVLDSWDEVTKERLDQWWLELSPRLESFRANCLTTQAFWKLVTGDSTHCS